MSYETHRDRARSVCLRGLAAVGDDLQRERLTELHKPFAGNPPALLKPTRCRVLKAFYVAGGCVDPGETVELPRHDADSMKALSR